jgi:hypothetical protein
VALGVYSGLLRFCTSPTWNINLIRVAGSTLDIVGASCLKHLANVAGLKRLISVKGVYLLQRMRMIFWLRRRWMSRYDTIGALEGLGKTRDNRLRDAVALAERLVIMRELVKKL